MPATRRNLTIEQGSDLDVVVTVLDNAGAPRNLAGWTARMQARRTVTDPTPLFDIAPDVDGPNGQVVVSIPGDETAGYVWLSGFYDLEITDGTTTQRVLQGQISVSPEITR